MQWSARDDKNLCIHDYARPVEAGHFVEMYPLRKMLQLATHGITSFSTIPLRFVTCIGLCSVMIAAAAIGYSLFIRLFTNAWVQDWTTLILALLFLCGLVMIQSRSHRRVY